MLRQKPFSFTNDIYNAVQCINNSTFANPSKVEKVFQCTFTVSCLMVVLVSQRMVCLKTCLFKKTFSSTTNLNDCETSHHNKPDFVGNKLKDLQDPFHHLVSRLHTFR